MDYQEQRKEELYSQVITAGKRRYFFDVITITESRKLFDNKTGEFYYDKNKMFLYKEDFEKFRKGFENALSFIETGIEPAPVQDDHYRADDTDARLNEIDFKF